MNSPKDHAIVAAIPKLPARCGVVVTPLLLSIITSCVVSFVGALKGFELTSKFASTWLATWGVSLAVALPARYLMTPVARWLTRILVRNP